MSLTIAKGQLLSVKSSIIIKQQVSDQLRPFLYLVVTIELYHFVHWMK